MAAELMTRDGTRELIESLRHEVRSLRREVRKNQSDDTVCVVCFSGDWDKLFAAFTIANGALAMNQDVHMFFTFWGACALRVPSGNGAGKRNWIQKGLSLMLPKSVADSPLSKMNCLGLSKILFRRLMRQNGVDDLPALIESARELGAKFHCCETSMRLFGWTHEDVDRIDRSDLCGVATFLSKAMKGRTTLFI